MGLVDKILKRVRVLSRRSELDYLISAEIKHDQLYRALAEIAATPGVEHILEIGSSSGAGSTEAFVGGIGNNPGAVQLHCLEVSRVRFAALAARYSSMPFVRCYNLSSVSLDRFPTKEDVMRFHAEEATNFSHVRLSEVLRWLEQDRRYLLDHGLSSNGIREVKNINGIELFDAVLIDGSEFTGRAELADVYGARFIVLDDICSFKNHDNYNNLSHDPLYRLLSESRTLRNGFAAFERVV